MKKFGIDVSIWQKDFDFAQAQREGVEFAIIKAGGGDGGLYKDPRYEENYSKAKAIGMPVGAYFFGAAMSVEQAEKEAKKFIELLKDHQFEMPVYYDVESKMLNSSGKLLTDIVFRFCELVEQAGYYVGIYSNEWVFNDKMDDKRLSRFAHWVAKWVKNKPKLRNSEVGLWQFGGSTNVIRDPIIAGIVTDQDYCYVDYETAIKKYGLNGFPKSTPEPEPTPEPTPEPSDEGTAFTVYVHTRFLNIRTGPGTNYPTTGEFTGRGRFDIVGTMAGPGAKDGWGQLKDGRGWISLDFAEVV